MFNLRFVLESFEEQPGPVAVVQINLKFATRWQFNHRRILAVEEWRQIPRHSLHAAIVKRTGKRGRRPEAKHVNPRGGSRHLNDLELRRFTHESPPPA